MKTLLLVLTCFSLVFSAQDTTFISRQQRIMKTCNIINVVLATVIIALLISPVSKDIQQMYGVK